MDSHKFIVTNAGGEHRVCVISIFAVEPFDKFLHQMGDISGIGGAKSYNTGQPVPYHHLPVSINTAIGWVFKHILCKELMYLQYYLFGDLAMICKLRQAFKHLQIIKDLSLCLSCRHNVPAHRKLRDLFKRKGIAFNRS